MSDERVRRQGEVMGSTRIHAWHFPRDGSRPAVGEVLCSTPPVLRASKRALDAIRLRCDPIVCRVECWGQIITEADDLAPDDMRVEHMRVIWTADATPVLLKYAEWCVDQVKSLGRRVLSPVEEVLRKGTAADAAPWSAAAACWAAEDADPSTTRDREWARLNEELERRLAELEPAGVV